MSVCSCCCTYPGMWWWVCTSVLGVVFTPVISVRVSFCLENLSWLGLVLWRCRGLFVQEMQPGVNHIPAQSTICSLSDTEALQAPAAAAASSSLVLAPPDVYRPPQWPQSMKWAQLNTTIKENSHFAEGFFWLKCGSPLEPTDSCTNPSGVFFEQGEEWMEWESLENAWAFTCARKACLATAQRLPHPEQMALIQLLWNLWTSGVPQRLCAPCRCSVCQVANM